ncbi:MULTISPECIES: hypothetical protein [unclassified Kitasatospora]|uniref:hypothetical protein n=1 Tax=unclassified Kitasatospora TaxID=2633591 RepID=UPI002474C839|nr:hypothetical protein [Kitasatospora sp. MAP12-44]
MTTLSLSFGGALAAGAALLGVSFAAVTPGPPAQTARAAAAAQPNQNCTLNVPANPLSPQGLATPYTLTATDPAQGPCNEANPNQSVFVQATVVDNNAYTSSVSVYNPLVIDSGTQPAVAPVVPKMPLSPVVGIWFGFNGGTLTLGGPGAAQCVGGTPGQPFGQFAYCNAPDFFQIANAEVDFQALTVPPLGTGKDGKPCLTTRDFGLVDQDQSDNVTAEYLATADGRTAQRTAANTAALPASTALLNGSDNLLLTNFEDPALGCTPWTAPDLADPGHTTTSIALNELQANQIPDIQGGFGPRLAMVPLNDPMVLDNGQQSTTKTNLYREGVDQPDIQPNDNGDPTDYCTNLATFGAQRINLDQQFTANAPSPQGGQNLFDFLTQRLAASLTNLNCQQATPAPAAKPSATAKPRNHQPTHTPSPTRP